MKKLIVAGLIGALVITVTACESQQNKSSPASSTVQEVTQSVEAFGVVTATNKKEIWLDFDAYVDKLHIKEGQKVKRGDKLVTLNISGLEEQLAQKQDEMNIAKLELGKLEYQIKDIDKLSLQKIKNGMSADSKELTQLKNDLALKKEQLKNNNSTELKKQLNEIASAQKLYDNELEKTKNSKALYELGAISKDDYDEQKKASDEKKKNLDDSKYSKIGCIRHRKEVATLKDEKSVRDTAYCQPLEGITHSSPHSNNYS